ncbi:MAG: sel1 repeat family protein [Gammaproteobacteria bacterium]|nr:MAG: sel1 repeat family protein [Gammaproteobacteria bacterium]
MMQNMRSLKLKPALFMALFMALFWVRSGYSQETDPDLDAHKAALAAYEKGDFETAFAHWKLLAEKDSPLAQYYMAVLYRDGAGVPQDYVQARSWYERAANGGSVRALHDLAVMYQGGVGVAQNFAAAFPYLELAAARGYAPSQYNLGVLLLEGKGTEADAMLGYVWIYRAATQGLEQALAAQGLVAQTLTLDQLQEARHIVEAGNDSQ